MSKQRFTARVALAALVICTVSSSVFGQQGMRPIMFKIDGPSERLEMVVTESRILTLQKKIPRLLVNNPDVVQATPLSPNQVQVSARRPGVTQLNIWDEDQKLHSIDVVVYADARELENLIKLEFPDAHIKIRPLANSVYLTGYVPSANQVRAIVSMSEDFYPNVINNLTVGGVQQIMLKVRVLEVSRTKARSAGFDWAAIDGSNYVLQTASGLLGGVTGTTLTSNGLDTVQFGVVNGNDAFFGLVEALRQNNLVKILAEPTLVTVSGRPASFNSGGEFPIVVPQSLGTVSVEYRQFGTRVDFVPLVVGNGNIRLEVRPTITEIDQSRSANLNGVSVPGLRTRWVDTAVEMQAGQTLALAGLIQNRVEAETRGIPWLGEMPWIGAAFRRVVEQNNEVELLIMVTPEFVDAMDAHEVPAIGPGQSTTNPNDVELFGRGYLEVPNCCFDGSCAGCRSGAGIPIEQLQAPAPAPAPVEGARMRIQSGRQASHAPNLAAPLPRVVTRATNLQASPPATNTPRRAPIRQAQPPAPVRNSPQDSGANGAPAAEPGLIGPSGYEGYQTARQGRS